MQTARTPRQKPGRLPGTLLVLAALLALAALLRLPSAGFGLPQRLHYDEKHTLDELELLRGDPVLARADPRFGIYPQLVPRLVCLIYPQAVEPTPGPLAGQLELASRDLLALRTIGALFALLAVPGTWFLARRFLDARGALVATALIATSVLHVWYSNHARPHGAASGPLVCALVCALAIRSRGSAFAYLGAGLFTGLAVGASQASLCVLPAILLAHLLRPRSSGARAHLWLACALGLVFLAAWRFCPAWFAGKQELAPVELDRESLLGGGAGRMLRGLWHFEPLLVGLAALGALYWLGRELAVRGARPPLPRTDFQGPRLLAWLRGREDLAILLVHALPWLSVLALYERSSQRYFLQLLPQALCLAAWVALGAGGWLARRTGAGQSGVLVLAPALLLIVLEGWLSLRVVRVLRAPDTGALAARWIEAHCDPSKDRIAIMPGSDLPLLRAADSFASQRYGSQRQTAWARYQVRLGERERGDTSWELLTIPLTGQEEWRVAREEPAQCLGRVGANYVVVELTDRAMPLAVIESLRSVSTRVARISPMSVDRGDDTPFLWWDQQNEYEEGRWWIPRLLQARSLGGVIEIRRVGSAAESR